MHATIISAYAPKITNYRPTDGDKFYQDLDGVNSATPRVCVCVCVCVRARAFSNYSLKPRIRTSYRPSRFNKFNRDMTFVCITLVTGFRKYTEFVQKSGERLYNRMAMLWRPSCRCYRQELVRSDSLF